MKQIYLDNAATTQLDKKVFDEMKPYLTYEYGNPGSMHQLGIRAKLAIDNSRKKVSEILNCSPEEIIFTGSGTESDNLAILGYARKNKDKGNHIITTSIEHHAVTDSFKRLEKEGFEVTFLDVDIDGFIDLEKLKKEIRDDTLFVSVIYANNEIGVIQDIKEISRICKERQVIFHTDACQAAGYLDIDVKNLGVDMMTLNGSKIYGPKGVGILYKRKGINIEPIIYGGGQEFNLRSGTENVANTVGFAKALELVEKHKESETKRITNLRDHMIDELLKIPETRLNGSREKRLPNNVNISFLNIEGESLILLLNEDGICCSTGSACTSHSLEPSHVIVALGLPHELGHSSIRFSLGKNNTREEIDYVLKKVPLYVEKLRKMSPLNYKMEEAVAKGRTPKEEIGEH
jgi:cysteine desulfurase